MKLMNNKGYMRILEAVISILIITGAVLVVVSDNIKNDDISDIVNEKQREIFEIISNNYSIRGDLLSGNKDSSYEVINKNIPNNWNYVLNLCKINEICNQGTPIDRDVYVSETIISANIDNYPNEEASKLRFFIWLD